MRGFRLEILYTYNLRIFPILLSRSLQNHMRCLPHTMLIPDTLPTYASPGSNAWAISPTDVLSATVCLVPSDYE